MIGTTFLAIGTVNLVLTILAIIKYVKLRKEPYKIIPANIVDTKKKTRNIEDKIEEICFPTYQFMHDGEVKKVVAKEEFTFKKDESKFYLNKKNYKIGDYIELRLYEEDLSTLIVHNHKPRKIWVRTIIFFLSLSVWFLSVGSYVYMELGF